MIPATGAAGPRRPPARASTDGQVPTEVANATSLRRMSPRSSLVGRVGDVAQLGERLNRTQEADGSIPFISTIFLLFFLTRGSAVMKFCESLPRLGTADRLFRGA